MRTLDGVANARGSERDRDEPVSLAPLDPETALRGLLAVKPEPAVEVERDVSPPEPPDRKRR